MCFGGNALPATRRSIGTRNSGFLFGLWDTGENGHGMHRFLEIQTKKNNVSEGFNDVQIFN